MDYLTPSFQSSFIPGYGTEAALVMLVDDRWWGWDGGSALILAFLNLSIAFNTIEHGILLGQLGGWG